MTQRSDRQSGKNNPAGNPNGSPHGSQKLIPEPIPNPGQRTGRSIIRCKRRESPWLWVKLVGGSLVVHGVLLVIALPLTARLSIAPQNTANVPNVPIDFVELAADPTLEIPPAEVAPETTEAPASSATEPAAVEPAAVAPAEGSPLDSGDIAFAPVVPIQPDVVTSPSPVSEALDSPVSPASPLPAFPDAIATPTPPPIAESPPLSSPTPTSPEPTPQPPRQQPLNPEPSPSPVAAEPEPEPTPEPQPQPQPESAPESTPAPPVEPTPESSEVATNPLPTNPSEAFPEPSSEESTGGSAGESTGESDRPVEPRDQGAIAPDPNPFPPDPGQGTFQPAPEPVPEPTPEPGLETTPIEVPVPDVSETIAAQPSTVDTENLDEATTPQQTAPTNLIASVVSASRVPPKEANDLDPTVEVARPLVPSEINFVADPALSSCLPTPDILAWGGMVSLRIATDEQGNLLADPIVRQSSQDSAYDQLAICTVKEKMRFAPATAIDPATNQRSPIPNDELVLNLIIQRN